VQGLALRSVAEWAKSKKEDIAIMRRVMHRFGQPLQGKKVNFTLEEWNDIATRYKMDETFLRYMARVARETEAGRQWFDSEMKDNLRAAGQKKSPPPQFGRALDNWIARLGEAAVDVEEVYGPARQYICLAQDSLAHFHEHWSDVRSKLQISTTEALYTVTNLFLPETGTEVKGPIHFESFFSHFEELVVNEETTENVRLSVGVHVLLCGRARLHDFLSWYHAGDPVNIWAMHVCIYIPHSRDGFTPDFSTDGQIVYVVYLWPTPGRIDDVGEARVNMTKHIGRQHLPSYILGNKDFSNVENDRQYSSGRAQPCQSAMAAIAHCVLKENRVIVNVWSGGPMTFEGLVSCLVSLFLLLF
jgi:hypothetical protein